MYKSNKYNLAIKRHAMWMPKCLAKETGNDDSQILTLLWSNFTLSIGQGKYCASSVSGQLPK